MCLRAAPGGAASQFLGLDAIARNVFTGCESAEGRFPLEAAWPKPQLDVLYGVRPFSPEKGGMGVYSTSDREYLSYRLLRLQGPART